MDVAARLDDFDHPAWTTGLATITGYALFLIAVFTVLFLVPWLVLSAL
ncbi:hypothetical protein [Salinarchaeum sp. Harcht-Bsk1]|nr:hypothetical protein [Salinarchaeum sp. Harcht-Bsk1]